MNGPYKLECFQSVPSTQVLYLQARPGAYPSGAPCQTTLLASTEDIKLGSKWLTNTLAYSYMEKLQHSGGSHKTIFDFINQFQRKGGFTNSF